MNKNMPAIVFFSIIIFLGIFLALNTEKVTGPDVVLNPTTSPSPTSSLTVNEKPSSTQAPAPTFSPVTELKIEDFVMGTGPEAASGSSVIVNYIGALTNGQVFDTSVNKQPIAFIIGAGRVIRGWEEGIIGMRVGGRRRLHIPPNLAYGERGNGGIIPANATLIFDIELLEMK